MIRGYGSVGISSDCDEACVVKDVEKLCMRV